MEVEIRIKMPPKKKGGGKKKAGKKTGGSKGPTIIDGVPVSEMTKEQLEGHVRRLQEEVCSTQCNLTYIQEKANKISFSCKAWT